MKISKLLIIVLLLSGCQHQKQEELTVSGFEALAEGDYSIVLPDVSNNARYWHLQVLSQRDIMNLGKRMQELCKSVFSSEDYVLTPGSTLNRADLVELQRRNSEAAPYGLNPPEGMYLDGETVLNSPYLVCDLVELNFISLKDQNSRKRAFTIVMNSLDVSDEVLIHAGIEASDRLKQYLRDVKEIDEDSLILIYASSDYNGTLPGRFLAICDDKIELLEEQWVYLPSKEAEELDSVLSSEFEQLKEKVKQFLPEHIDLVGEVFFMDNMATQLKIDVNVQAKTYTEIDALAQCLASSIKEINNASLTITCQIRVLDTTLFVLERKQNQDEVNLIKL